LNTGCVAVHGTQPVFCFAPLFCGAVKKTGKKKRMKGDFVMGQGINGVIPISFKVKNASYLPPSYLDRYEFTEDNLYRLKKDILFDNFRSLLADTRALLQPNDELLGTDEDQWGELDKFAAQDDLEGYLDFLEDNPNHSMPSYYPCSYSDELGLCICDDIVVCHGSYKAYLEEYTTLHHLNALFYAAFPGNPLAKTMRFVIFG
jgi:hypothetical protein